MSEASPEARSAPTDWSRSLPFGVSAAVRDAVRHQILLQRCFDGREMRWTDTLIARLRRHAGGCISSTEIALRSEIARRVPPSLQMAELLPELCCWRRVQRDPALVSSMLLNHFRDRAALSLMQQHEVPWEQKEEKGAGLFPLPVAEMLPSLVLAESAWSDGGSDETPMCADLPAEMMPELVWTVGAILADAISDTSLPKSTVLALVDAAGSELLAKHDEQTAPLAMANLFAHRLRAAGINDEQLLYLARNRHILPLLAIIADRAGIDLAALVRTIVDGTEQMLFILSRAAELPREAAVRLVLARRSVVRGVDDSMLVEYADGYDLISPGEAKDAVIPLGIAEPFWTKLSLIRGAGRDGR